ncbi:hypothetical protein R3X28_08550 [Maribacter sp. TH_r10]|uniref:DUF2946 domain-containing protein n=1 Tax=Maribacter luteus TaxID=2594478 RepID=A0A6I2MNS8_9FLAO|nr:MULTISPECIES: hypothetical protein [Maribacter]MDV7138924.1 hypothetical protein [Maribacter sp. TH_r10]MRX63914.1 hypothetical protein [Maribacter luteus]
MSFFFLAILIFVKASAFHVFAHEDEDGTHIENCLVCTMAMEMQQTVHDQPDTLVFDPEVILVDIIRSFGIDNNEIISTQPVFSYFSRPPPSLLS